ncbi:MAG: 16S rRNA (cytosine(1402)-N(4))-methyltransferase RsmH [Bacteroidales bacterium]|nr:16S rRNA (cytosine(1402)-N(4))-methyltransferase RsmH [Lentimicrobiaceae bacterium]MDD5694182.1 16S rRNA (cytosine(1402)-N(4))-methyltransferase RsmH [Bacteroidales bacterium]
MVYHEPVLLKESIEGLAIQPDAVYVDATYGGGGHARKILEKLRNGRLIAFDQDADAMNNRIDDPRLLLLNHNFRYMKRFLRYYHVLPVEGILADLGVSSHQLDRPERGFSTRFGSTLDLRMDRKKSLTALRILNEYPEERLRLIFKDYGEVPNASRLTGLIVRNRRMNAITDGNHLQQIIAGCLPKGGENRYLAQVYQALRIEVNQELEALRELLQQSVSVLKPGGRLVIITYHSLEDRIVKNFMRSGNLEGKADKDFFGRTKTPFRLITRKPIVPGEEELSRNPRSRSAKLRIAEVLNNE